MNNKRYHHGVSLKNKGISAKLTASSKETSSQTKFADDHFTQTNPFSIGTIIPLASLSSKQLSSLQSFLTKTEPLIIKELNESIETQNIFNDYVVEWEDAPNSICLESKLHFESSSNISLDTKDGNRSNQDLNANLFGGTCLDYNHTNSRIAIGYGSQQKHTSLCLHSTHVVIWNIIGNHKDPEHCIEISSCCTSIRYHPVYDNILCFGLFNGLITILQLDNNGNSLQNKEICKSVIDDYYHKEIITDLQWIKTQNASAYHLVSISIDGKLLIWDFEYNKLENPIFGYRLIPTKTYNANPMHVGRDIGFNEISITNISFPQNECNSFIISTQCGAIINCLIDHHSVTSKKNVRDGDVIFDFMAGAFYKNVANKSHQIEIRRNLIKYMKLHKGIKVIRLKDIFSSNLLSQNDSFKLYPSLTTKLSFNKKHIGFVNNVQFSPFSRNIFLTSSINGYLQIFSIFSSLPIIELTYNEHRIFDSKWSPIRPCVVALINSTRELIIYDLFRNRENQYIPSNVIKVSDDKIIKLNKVCFNKAGNKIFIIDNIGNLYVYQLSNLLTQHQPKEIKHLQKWINLKV